ncbi:hypothetical protein HPB47_022745 [Ixodes persulcatus]|uniref:Uncharacterized protein n=1 Tax=Ixodes persulcatus TaxID=34615 RepID=A0AC60Q8V6_IXOPE|nr:hypothetical protein HPB47_022745 [Ixodes persulcatus]
MKETYEATIMTTRSTVAVIEYLLTDLKFKYVLTRPFNSDPVESLFSCFCQFSGGNDRVDARAAAFTAEKLLKVYRLISGICIGSCLASALSEVYITAVDCAVQSALGVVAPGVHIFRYVDDYLVIPDPLREHGRECSKNEEPGSQYPTATPCKASCQTQFSSTRGLGSSGDRNGREPQLLGSHNRLGEEAPGTSLSPKSKSFKPLTKQARRRKDMTPTKTSRRNSPNHFPPPSSPGDPVACTVAVHVFRNGWAPKAGASRALLRCDDDRF